MFVRYGKTKDLLNNLEDIIFSRIPCRHQFSFCGVCFHGGHVDHIEKWFENHHLCPYGCGHDCKNHNNHNRRELISQPMSSKS